MTPPTPPEREGAGLIAAERKRQVESEGWTAEHDDGHRDGAIALAAATYATPGVYRKWRRNQDTGETIPDTWPERWAWKPTDRVRELTKAGALIAAEIDRLLRAEGAPR